MDTCLRTLAAGGNVRVPHAVVPTAPPPPEPLNVAAMRARLNAAGLMRHGGPR